jgi:hypothetical protein
MSRRDGTIEAFNVATKKCCSFSNNYLFLR